MLKFVPSFTPQQFVADGSLSLNLVLLDISLVKREFAFSRWQVFTHGDQLIVVISF